MSKIILLVDDDEDDAAIFSEAMNEVYTPVSVEYMNDGLLLVEKLGDKDWPVPDIIFLDINMSGISGWDCLKMLKQHERYRQVPVVMYSTSNNPKDVEKAQQLGATDFMTKPHSFGELKDLLRAFINRLW